jgi:hypothetical protein
VFKALRSHAEKRFNARSSGRDAETDVLRLGAIETAIEQALQAATAEKEGLNRRIEDVLARVAVTLGNDSDEYLERDPVDSERQNMFSHQIAEGQRRLEKLSKDIEGFKILKNAFKREFSNDEGVSEVV